MPDGCVVVVGGTSGLGREVAAHYQKLGRDVVITGRDQDRTAAGAAELGSGVTPMAVDLTEPKTIAAALQDVGPVSRLVLAAIVRDNNKVREYSIDGALNLLTVKLIGYTETVHVLVDRMSDESSVVLFGGLAKERPYPGSTTVTTVNGGVSTLITTLALELAPIRFNAIHPAFVPDTPFWTGKSLDHVLARTPTGRLPTMADVVDATVFVLENRAINGVNLYVDGGWMLM
jgi:NAD(P)-dependent dehydrogenase (short-subunit alcohol dehydrogenase family)